MVAPFVLICGHRSSRPIAAHPLVLSVLSNTLWSTTPPPRPARGLPERPTQPPPRLPTTPTELGSASSQMCPGPPSWVREMCGATRLCTLTTGPGVLRLGNGFSTVSGLLHPVPAKPARLNRRSPAGPDGEGRKAMNQDEAVPLQVVLDHSEAVVNVGFGSNDEVRRREPGQRFR